MRAGKFHIYPVGRVEEGIELLTGVPAGEKQDDGSFPEETVFARVAARLEEIRDALKEESETDKENHEDEDSNKKDKEMNETRKE